MFCSFCGKEISDSAKFCPFCGGGVSAAEEVSAPVEPVTPAAPAAPAAPQYQLQGQPQYQYDIPVAQPPKKKKKNVLAIVLASIAGVLAFLTIMGALVYHFVLPKVGLYGDFYDIMDEAGEAYEYEEDEEKAQKLLNRAYRAATDDSERSEVWQARGIIAYLEGDEEEAAKHLRKAIDLDAWTAELYLMLATCYLDMGDEDTAFDVLMEGWAVFPGDGGIENMLWDEFDYDIDYVEEQPAQMEPEEPVEAMPEEPAGGMPEELLFLVADTDPMYDLGFNLGFEVGHGMDLDTSVISTSDVIGVLCMLEAGEGDVVIAALTEYDCENYGFDLIYTEPFCEWGGLEYSMILRPDSTELCQELDRVLREYKESGYLEELVVSYLPDATLA
ncbi:MAG: tetratricopeptide repeat protein [Oscillospiraceae bacterium]|nr:tetratricopeptide repeat protein [Oscillospiraceae bacterium]